MKKTLLSLCIMLAAIAGQAFANNDNDVTGNKRFTVSVSTNEGGKIEIEGTGEVSENSVASATINTGEDVVLIITANEGYELTSLYVDGTNVTEDIAEDNTYTINAIAKNISVTGTFEQVDDPRKPGDVNGDGIVDTQDVVDVYSYIANSEDSGLTLEMADIDGSGLVDSADVVALYGLITNN